MTFDDFTERGEAAIADLVDARAQEGLQLEFKSGKIFRNGALERSGREGLANTMSSFANSAGGLLVIGVDCRKIDRIDAASALVPITNLPAALTSITDLIGDALQPRHDGIVWHAIATTTDPSQGYLVVSVPRSDRRPHMSSVTKSYYNRAGASKFQMEHYDVEDAFKRQTGPDITLDYDLNASEWPSGGAGSQWRYILQIAAVNKGSGSAKQLMLRYAEKRGIYDSHLHHNQIPGHSATLKGVKQFTVGPETAVHPGAEVVVLRLFFTLVLLRGQLSGFALDSEGRITLPIEVLAEGMQPRTVVLTLTHEALRKVVPERS